MILQHGYIQLSSPAQSTSLFPSFHWPVPRNYTIVDGSRDVAKSVMLVMMDGSRQMGALVDFGAIAKTMSLYSGNRAPLRIDLASFKMVHFTRGMPLLNAGQQNAAGATESVKQQKLTLQCVDGEEDANGSGRRR